MGRGRATRDPFAPVFGSNRGHPETEADGVLSKRPNARSKEALRTLRQTLIGATADPREAFDILAAMHATEERRPLEKVVREMLARHYARQAVLESEPTLRRIMSDSAIYDSNVSEHIVEVAANQPNLALVGPSIHLWVQGHLYRTPEQAPGALLLACGHTVPKDQTLRLKRGSWNTMPAPSPSGTTRCGACMESVRVFERSRNPDYRPPSGEKNILRTNLQDIRDIERLVGETRDYPQMLSALPYHTSRSLRKHLLNVLSDRLSVGIAASSQAQESSARAEYLVLAFKSAASYAHRSQTGWLRRMGIDVPSVLEDQMPLIEEQEIEEMLRSLYPPAYHISREWQTLGDLEAWEDWLASRDYQTTLLRFKEGIEKKFHAHA